MKRYQQETQMRNLLSGLSSLDGRIEIRPLHGKNLIPQGPAGNGRAAANRASQDGIKQKKLRSLAMRL
ncbi:MAG: hypothetical protein A2508_00305 [Candidatus Lambdaproteobacteria bacterium RIFOXYD12_FULL_49_8]|uniref:Uncharacterized protein n=1 Tax=Candidatus Lambdaproteobacteria bacterium RIFOXYD2_FULL_50_16 TaxID=1817772 RepID=A0A1F6GDA9_9PROT|nr:MAG: hypothetical protein A2527_12390 [Candidatus Lambdaproteobacteria bacterium RIFOXYD2_FULL_50_16]OGG97307.1 MAG: hypothetical protein A2508_00305 [Candidatus Lambdaproteobacteria bacterium RIFOXYD12_FULL_49_8]